MTRTEKYVPYKDVRKSCPYSRWIIKYHLVNSINRMSISIMTIWITGWKGIATSTIAGTINCSHRSTISQPWLNVGTATRASFRLSGNISKSGIVGRVVPLASTATLCMSLV